MSAVPPLDMEKILTAFGNLAEMNGAVLDLVIGYRRQCEERGFSPTAAEMMAMEYHRALLQQIWRQASG